MPDRSAAASVPDPRLGGGALIEEHLVVMELSVGAHTVESGTVEDSLRSNVVQRRVGDHAEDSVVGGHVQQSDDRLRA